MTFFVGSASPTIFDEAVQEIKELLKSDILPKFHISNTYNLVTTGGT